MDHFDYSPDFRDLIIALHRGKEDWPYYQNYLKDHLGGPDSRLIRYIKYLCPEIEYHCGSLKNHRVLDFGCGTGATTAALAYRSTQICGQICGFDIDHQSVEICRRRLREHQLETTVQFYCADDLETVKESLGSFDVILVNGVIEHIPLTKVGLREKTVRSLFRLLRRPGYLYINDTPNRLLPFDFHSTRLWWIPWTKPGSEWAYRRAIKKGRHSENPSLSPGPLGLEELGAWGATYWEIKGYLKGERFVCLNTVSGHNRHLFHFPPPNWQRRALPLLEFVAYYSLVKALRLPMTAFCPGLPNLVFKRC